MCTPVWELQSTQCVKDVYFRTYMFWLIAIPRDHEDTSFLSVLFCILYVLFYVILIRTVWKSSYIYFYDP